MKSLNSYFPVHTIQTSACLEFTTLDDFCRFSKAHQLFNIFILLNENNEAEHFAIVHNNILFRQAALGFKTLEDYAKACQNGFPDAGCFYESLQMDYQMYEDYRLVKEAGISCKETFDKMKTTHFISGFENYNSLLESGASLPSLPPFANPYELYKYAINNGFADYTQFRKAISKGFTDAAVYNVACEHGFPSYDDYSEAMQKGFRQFDDLKLAREKGIRDNNDMMHFIDLETVHCVGCCHDQKILLTLLSKIEQGRKISINKLKDLINTRTGEYRYEDTNQMPSWFTVSMQNDEAIIGFLHSNEQAKKFGHYDLDGEYFEINRMKDRSVILDGSNVAHNSHGNGNSKPSVTNIIKVVEHLKKEGFTDITVIADAALKHRLQDGNRLPQLKQMADYLESPRETPADIFLIQYVKKNRCLLISNDTFKDWKVQDAWTAENIDFYRLAFMIKGDQVLMPDLK